MRNLRVNHQELKLIEAGLHLRNRHNIGVVNNEHGYTSNKQLQQSCMEEMKIIDSLIVKVRELLHDGILTEPEEIDEVDASLTMSIRLDTTQFDNALKKLGEKLLTLSEI